MPISYFLRAISRSAPSPIASAPVVACLGALLLAPGCASFGAEVTGTAAGVKLGETDAVYFGGPFLVIASAEIDCTDLAFVRQNYENGVAPAEFDLGMLQFTWVAGSVSTGLKQIAPDASVTAKMLSISGDVFVESDAASGSITLDVLDKEEAAEGTFTGLSFDDGTLSGSFSAEWCLNLREW